MSVLRSLFHSATPEEVAAARSKAETIINDNAVVVFAKSYCPYSAAARLLLKGQGIEYFSTNVDLDSDGAAMQRALRDMTRQTSVPNIFIGRRHIGGNSELQRLNRKGQLKPLLHEVGALGA